MCTLYLYIYLDPHRDLGIAVWISMLSVTGIYVLTNVAYFSVLGPSELIASDAVALVSARDKNYLYLGLCFYN